ncbi:hypothetical protein TNCV_581881 [Trichonephila clavipes]|nr:hypothetical protein TNCV_581881 [Trichonephila clavipes]
MEYRLSEHSLTENKMDDREGQYNVWDSGNCKDYFTPVRYWPLGRVVEVYHRSDGKCYVAYRLIYLFDFIASSFNKYGRN